MALEPGVPQRVAEIRDNLRSGIYSSSYGAERDLAWLLARLAEAENDRDEMAALRAERATLVAENIRLTALVNTPEVRDFTEAVVREAAHQRERWGTEHDGGKEPEDWFWLLGYLGGKALAAARAGHVDKALHHTISSAAALANWHAHLLTGTTFMRPGIDGEAALAPGVAPAPETFSSPGPLSDAGASAVRPPQADAETPRYYATHRVFTGKPISRGYVYDRTTGKVVESCPHTHPYGHTIEAQACAEKMLVRWLDPSRPGGPQS